MSIKEQAIKMEQLKQERSETDNATFAEILSVSREIDSISNELFKLGDKRAKLYEKLSELKEKRKRDTAAEVALCENVLVSKSQQTKRDNP